MGFPIRLVLLMALLTASLRVAAYQVSVGTDVSNADKTVTVPVMIDSAAGLPYASATLT